MKTDATGRSNKRDVANRVIFLLDSLWQGNRTAMANAVGCCQSAVSQIATGRRPPGRSLLTRIASLPVVNPGWLLTGDGEPLLTTKGVQTTEPCLPISDRPLTGSPLVLGVKLTGETFPVQHSFAGPGRYWLRIKPGTAITKDGQAKVDADDLVLMESSSEVWLADPPWLDRRIGFVQLGKAPEGVRLQLVVFQSHVRRSTFTLTARVPGKTKRIAIDLQGPSKTHRRDKSSQRGLSLASRRLRSVSETASIEQIVGAAVLMVRQVGPSR